MPFIEDNPDPAVRLAHFAAGENCDGEPYDTMQAGADEIAALRARVAELERELRLIREHYNLTIKIG